LLIDNGSEECTTKLEHSDSLVCDKKEQRKSPPHFIHECAICCVKLSIKKSVSCQWLKLGEIAIYARPSKLRDHW